MSPVVPRLIAPARLRHTLCVLVTASALCAAVLCIRFVIAQNFRLSGFLGNLLLAWIPLLAALHLSRGGARRRLALWWAVALVWFLFFPNAFYLVTDLIHLKKFGTDGIYRWYDLLLTTLFACAGMFLGSVSLYLLHLRVRARWGWRRGWLFATALLFISAFGIYIGRLLRLNSWDPFIRPLKLVRDILSLADSDHRLETAAFTVAFFVFSLAIYLFIVSIARLHEPMQSRDFSQGPESRPEP